MTTNSKYAEAFSHNVGVITQDEQDDLRRTTVAVAGVGGVGGNTLHVLARSGIGRFTIADPDVFSAGNINRQFGATPATVGRKKVDVLAEQIASINPEASIRKFPDGLTVDNVEDFLDGADVIVDAIDFLSPDVRKRLVDVGQRKNLYSFFCPAFGFGASLVVFAPGGLSYSDFFGASDGKPSARSMVEHGCRIFPVLPKYADLLSYLKGMKGESHVPTFAAPVVLAGALTAADVILHVLGRKAPVCVPRVKWIDLMEQTVKIINVRRRALMVLPTLLTKLRLKKVWLAGQVRRHESIGATS